MPLRVRQALSTSSILHRPQKLLAALAAGADVGAVGTAVGAVVAAVGAVVGAAVGRANGVLEDSFITFSKVPNTSCIMANAGNKDVIVRLCLVINPDTTSTKSV